MIVMKEFIWYSDHFVFHITEEKNMLSIMENGLLPLNGDRCKSIMDERQGVFCLDGLYNVENWAEILYGKSDLETLKLLRFNLKRRKWYMDNSNPNAFGMYLPYKVLSNKLDYLKMIDSNGENLPFTKLFDLDFIYKIDESFNNIENNKEIIIDNCSLSWEPIHQYKKQLKL